MVETFDQVHGCGFFGLFFVLFFFLNCCRVSVVRSSSKSIFSWTLFCLPWCQFCTKPGRLCSIRDVSAACVEEQAHSFRESGEVHLKYLFHRLQSQRTVSIFHLPMRLIELVLTKQINKIPFIFVFEFCLLLVYLFRRFMDYWTVFVDGTFLINKQHEDVFIWSVGVQSQGEK